MALLLGLGIAHAEVVPITHIKTLVESADLIVVGEVKRVQQVGTGSIEFGGGEYERLDFQAEINVDEVIKGQPVTSRFIFDYSTPSADPFGNVARGALVANTYGVVLLKKTVEGYAFVSPYSSTLFTIPKSCGQSWQIKLGEDVYHRVLGRVLTPLCASSTSEERNWALMVINWEEDRSVAPFLMAVLALPEVQSDQRARVTILSDLVRLKELSVLPSAEEELFEPSKHTPPNLESNLIFALSTLAPDVAVPLLARALRLPENEARLSAARFLEYTNSPKAIDVLLTDLEDSDREVQFAVMQSLGNLTDHHWWRPTTTETDSRWKYCIERWREFKTERDAVRQ